MIASLRRTSTREVGRDDRGFTLIELLVVVVIIGVLIAIAVPLYSNYKKGAANTSASSDVRGAISAVEQFYTANGNQYPANVTGTKGTNVTLALSGGGGTTGTITVSAGNTIVFTNNSTSYVICGQNEDGQTIYTYNSATSKSVAKSSATSLATCASATS
ncbi:prepilin-type N-terminal cleavage/methylation domain-containing protein [Cryptosporangium phraense]|uniref:Prepilin-type N-terminal cleavage/methylation domain-containing protein n=1 Tax=Cryptosporangium phraense TaxID=2593070 RepID=A0A545AVV2_9ACTN|nr:prepilin-type N-terminal cleavage/methylation domain-containing protein [Cryptosporangium phraense]TQS45391.1 prepilin-type N-terminal cleavage/methylation domain-containing protein [Cryptosporangium phraense]